MEHLPPTPRSPEADAPSDLLAKELDEELDEALEWEMCGGRVKRGGLWASIFCRERCFVGFERRSGAKLREAAGVLMFP